MCWRDCSRRRCSKALGQNVIIDNRGGAGGALGARALAAADPDGYTLFFGNTSTLAVIPAVVQESRLQPGEELCAGRERLRKLHDPGGAPVVPGQDAAGIHRLRQGQSRQAQLRPRRRRQRHAPDRRDVQVAGKDRFRRRAAPRRRGIDHQPARPAGGFPVREPGRSAAAHPRRQAACARRDQRQELRPVSRPWSNSACRASSRPC